MNATSTDIVEEIYGGSDSDPSPEDVPEYYQPITAVDDDDSGSDLDEMDSEASHTRGLPNGYYVHEAEDGMSSMHLNNAAEAKSEDEEEEEEEGESAITIAFREDENRRNAPLSQEVATRVMEAMRGVSFGGSTPDWANQVSDDHWMDRLRRIRQPQRATSTNVQN